MLPAKRELLRFLPRVLRARDFHLYLENGKRLTDLWLAGGKAVLGHKPPRVLVELKKAAERGLFTPIPHPMERRYLKALGELFPGRSFRLYTDTSSLRRAFDEAGILFPLDELLPDPAFPEYDVSIVGEKISLWRPFMGSQKETLLLAPVLPWPLGPEVLALEKGLDASFPAGEIIPPVLLAPATRALYDLLAAIKDGDRTQRVYPRVEKAVKGGPWRRRGIYLTIKTDREKYENLFLCFLESGFLIPPSPVEPLILPASMSDGEESKLAGLLGDGLLT